jgi:cytoskeletal protein CcmA (bactofilin family)
MAKWGKLTADTAAGDMSTLLGKDAEVVGTVRTQGSVRIDGKVTGDLHSVKMITVGATGVIDGDLHAESIIVAGRVKGSLHAKGKIQLESTADVDGDLSASRLSIQEGAKFRGRSSMDEPRVPMSRPTIAGVPSNLPKVETDTNGGLHAKQPEKIG